MIKNILLWGEFIEVLFFLLSKKEEGYLLTTNGVK